MTAAMSAGCVNANAGPAGDDDAEKHQAVSARDERRALGAGSGPEYARVRMKSPW